MSDERKEEMFQFLDGLRETGATNMFGAAPYLVGHFEIDKREARAVLKEWMETFSQREAQREAASNTKGE